MTSPIITEAVRMLVDRGNLTRIEAAAAMEAIMSGGATNAQIAAFLTALRMKGETVEELIGFAQVMRQKVVQGADPRRRHARADGHGPRHADRHLRDRRRRVRHLQCLDRHRLRGRGRRAPRRQARQPLRLVAVRVGRRGGDARHQRGAVARQGRPLRGRGGHRLPVRAAPAHRDEARDGGAPRDGHPHRLQHARAAHQSRRRQRPGDRRVRGEPHRAARPRARRARHAPRLRRSRRRRPRRDLEYRREPHLRGARGRGAQLARTPGGLRARPRARSATCRAGTARRTRRSSGGSSPATPARGATSC